MCASQLITNQTKFLHEVINNILPSSQNLFFLVGYFYFSGYRELYKNLRDKNLKILVGMEIEAGFQNKIKEFQLLEKVERSRGSIMPTGTLEGEFFLPPEIMVTRPIFILSITQILSLL